MQIPRVSNLEIDGYKNITSAHVCMVFIETLIPLNLFLSTCISLILFTVNHMHGVYHKRG